jgi:non-specific serine/threonine protein kinase
MSLAPNTRLGRYEIRSQIGAGGMGEVYLARDSVLGRDVALKVLPPEFAAEPQRLARFTREARAASALNHPHILTVYDVGEDAGTHFIVTELVEGRTLRDWVGEERPPLAELADAVRQAALALDAAHRANIVHRDVKPENLMRREDGFVKVLDFGIAKSLTPLGPAEVPPDPLAVTQTGMVLGTVRYMSPEQASGSAVDARADVWSLGVVLYELAAGRPPFGGESLTATLVAIMTREPAPLAGLLPHAPEALCRVVERALRKERDERYPTAAEMAEALEAVARATWQSGEAGALTQASQAGRGYTTVRLSAGGGAGAVGAGATSSAPPTNLPPPTSELIGRGREMAEVTSALRAPEARLLTLTGPGGTGKTRLAVEAARELLGDVPDGVYVVDLSPHSDSATIAAPIAQALGVVEPPAGTLADALARHLSGKRLLLVLDNFEHLLEGAPLVSTLLTDAPGLKVLATSRAPLRLSREREYAVEPLELPAPAALPPPDELARVPAVALFVERARQVKPSFELTAENAPAVAEVCRRLDGLPLALELAAARVKLLTPRAMLDRLDHSLKLLTGGARDLPTRQQTMRGAVEWSYDLLDEEERAVLRRLAVFVGGCTLEAAEAVCGAGGGDVLDALGSLVEKSLLRQREQDNGEPRFSLLEVVREYALGALEAGGEAGEVGRLHAEFYVRLAEAVEPELRTGRSARLMETLEWEHDNLRAAVEWGLGHRPEIALRIVGAIYNFWFRRSYLSEGVKWTKLALERSGAEADAILRAKACIGIGCLSWRRGELRTAELFTQESVRLSREAGDQHWTCSSLQLLGTIKIQQEELPRARALAEESLALARELNNRRLISLNLNALGELARQREDYEAARAFYEEALTPATQESAKHMIPVYTLNLASVACLQRDYQSATSFALEALKISEEFGDKIVTGTALGVFAAAAVAAGEPAKAARLWGAAQAIFDAADYKLDKVDQVFVDRYAGEARKALGDGAYEAAFREGRAMRLERAVALAREARQG